MKKNVFSSLKKRRDINKTLENRTNIIIICTTILFLVVFAKLYYIDIIKKDYYIEKSISLSEKTTYSKSTPRGRIYDRNYNLIVDNKPIKTIYYQKPKNISKTDEIELAKEVLKVIDIEYSSLHTRNLKEYWLVVNEDAGKNKIKEDEWDLFKKRKLTLDEIYELKIDRITEEELNNITEDEKQIAYLYFLMNKGYSYDKKIIKNKSVTEKEYATVAANSDIYPGFLSELDWEREYLYDDVFRSIIGSVGSISSELKDYYMDLGYKLDDKVGTSYLEFQYENILKGKKAEYKITSDNKYELIKEGSRGDDIVLSIDIKLQKYLEKLLEEELLIAKKEPNTKYFNKTFVVITQPSTGEILAMAGKQIIEKEDKYSFLDYTPGVITSSVTPGSIVKGASITAGYREGAIDIGTKFYDQCLKIKSTPTKCSWKSYGLVNDIEAIKYSSNVYQFLTAIKVGGGTYSYNQPLSISTEAFDIYRETFAEYGLGIKTGIDLPNESLGYIGTSTQAGHLLDFAIGNYDTYTPIQLMSYAQTIANSGTRLKLELLKEVYDGNSEGTLDSIKYSFNPVILNKVNLEEKYIKRIREEFKEVMTPGGTGYGYIYPYLDPSGKTGTAESFIDTNNDGKIDKNTITKSFLGYVPSNNPEMVFIITSPDLRYSENNSTYTSGINKRIASKITNYFFSNK